MQSHCVTTLDNYILPFLVISCMHPCKQTHFHIRRCDQPLEAPQVERPQHLWQPVVGPCMVSLSLHSVLTLLYMNIFRAVQTKTFVHSINYFVFASTHNWKKHSNCHFAIQPISEHQSDTKVSPLSFFLLKIPHYWHKSGIFLGGLGEVVRRGRHRPHQTAIDTLSIVLHVGVGATDSLFEYHIKPTGAGLVWRGPPTHPTEQFWQISGKNWPKKSLSLSASPYRSKSKDRLGRLIDFSGVTHSPT